MSRDTANIRLVLTILSLSRGILGGTPVDTKAITAASKAVISRELIDHVYDALEYLKISPGTVPEANSFHWTTKAGPNGPALSCSVGEVKLLPEWLNKAIDSIGRGLLVRTRQKL